MRSIMRMIPVLALCFACLLGLAACSGGQAASSSAAASSSGEAASPSVEASSQAAVEPSSASMETVPTDQMAIGQKALVAYYSATGNTALVAGMIAEDIDATVLAIEPEEPYTAEDLDYNNEASRVAQEHNDPNLQQVALMNAEVPDWDTYDTVFIGYPIWWGEAAWPVASFVAANDFSGKNVVPFCTSASSGLGSSAQGLQQLAGTGYWAEGMRFSSEPTQEEVNSWIQSFILDTNQ